MKIDEFVTPFWHVRYQNISLLLAFGPLYIDTPNLSQSMFATFVYFFHALYWPCCH
jgi:hypothetical protein